MTQRSNRGKRRAQPKSQAAPASDQYSKYLPEWMKANGGVAPPKPRVRRARQQRPVGGYTPGKFATGGDPLA